LAITIGSIAYLILTDKLHLADLRVSSEGWYWIPVAGLFVLSQIVIIQCRLWLLLHASDVKVGLGRVVKIGFISWFLNASLLGGIGFLSADAVRAAYLAQHSDRRSEIVGAVLIDRVVGLMGLLTFAFVSLMIGLRAGIGEGKLAAISLPIYAVLALTAIAGILLIVARTLGRMAAGIATAALAIAAAVLAHNGHALPSDYWIVLVVLLVIAASLPAFVDDTTFVRWAGTENRIGRFLIGVLTTIAAYRKKAGTLLAAYLAALCGHGLSIVALFILAHGISIGPLPTLAQTLFAAPIALLTAVLPLPANGLGVGEAAFDAMLRLSQSFGGAVLTGGAALYLAYRILGTLMALTGLPFFLASKRPAAPTNVKP
jgi:hypothetical protein